MRKIITTLFLFISILCPAANYYVKNGGNDADTGTDDTHAWETIIKVNASSFSAGDSILFKKGDTFIGTITPGQSGTLGNYIVFGSYGTGARPIIMPTNVAVATWTVHSGDIWKTTDIAFNPANIITSNDKHFYKINDSFFTNPCPSEYGSITSLEMMAKSTTDSITPLYTTVKINFWDGLDALFCYNSGTTYIRFRNGEDPNDSTFYFSGVSSRSVYLAGNDYITIRDLHIKGGDYGIYIYGGSTAHALYNKIDNCYIESSNKKIYLLGYCHYTTVINSTLTNDYLSPYEPGAWDEGTDYEHGVYTHYYRFSKVIVDLSDSGNTDAGIRVGGGQSDNCTYNNNTITNVINVISVDGSDCEIYNNTITNSSSVGVILGNSCDGVEVYDNYLTNVNIPFRFASVADTIEPPRTYYVYRNRIYNKTAGTCMYIHYGALCSGASQTTCYIYHNSFISKLGIDVDGCARNDPSGTTGFVFINNIISTNIYNTGGTVTLATIPNILIFYYNWIGDRFYGTSGISVFADNGTNVIELGDQFWNHAIDPPDFTDLVGLGNGNVINTGIDISTAFVLGGVNYSALPGTDAGDYWDEPDMGWYEYTGDDPLTITTTEPYWASLTTAIGGGNVLTEGTGTVTARGVCWNTTGTPTVSDDKTTDGGGTGSFASTMVGLKFGTTYYVRAYATNEHGTGYGGQYTFRQQLTKHNSKIIKHLDKFIIID